MSRRESLDDESEESPETAPGRQITSLVHSEGGDVNLTINGDVKIVAGGGHGGYPEVTVSSSTRQSGEHSSVQDRLEDSQKFARLCNVVNKQTCRTITTQISGNFKDENLCEPSFKVYPQMRKVTDFFKGGYEKWQEEIVTDRDQLGQGPGQPFIRNQIRKEVGFYYQGEQNRDEIITKDQLVDNIMKKTKLRPYPHDRNPVVAVVASAGSGKTTLLRRIAEETLNSCRIFRYEGKPEAQESHLQMIYFKDMKHMRINETVKPSQFLFHGLYQYEYQIDEAYQWLVDHQDEAILFFDGLDQATFSVDESSERNITTYEKGTCSEIMFNILSRNLLPRVKIVIASREFKVSELPVDARPPEIISLVGFKREDAERLFIALIIDHGAKIWENINNLSQRLLNILSVPVFLVLTAAIMARNPNDDPPETITELYNRILLSLRRVNTIQERRQIMTVIRKLKKMAHQGMVDGRVVFHQADLTKFELEIQDARDLMIKVPGNNFLSQYLLEGDFEFFFCHQSLQEFLSASFIVEMEEGEFLAFNNSKLHKSRWSVVRTFVSGIIHDKATMSELHAVSDQELKKRSFDESIPTQIENEENGVGLLAAIYESNDDNLILSLPRLPSMSGSRIGPNEAFMFGSVLARRGNVREVMIDLYECGLTDELVDVIVQELGNMRIQVDDLDLKFNSFTANGLNSLLAHLDATCINLDYPRVSDFRYGQLNWTNIRKIRWGSIRKVNWEFSSPLFEMVNEEDIVAIKGLINGRFNKATTETGTPDERLSISDGTKSQLLDLMIFFEKKTIEETSGGPMLVTAAKLIKMKALNMKGKVKEMLLDCRLEKNIDSTVIVSCVETFEVTELDILVNCDTTFLPVEFLSNIGDYINLQQVNVNIHWWFKLEDVDDVNKCIDFVNEKEIKSIRLQCHSKDVTLDKISAIIKKCDIRKLAMKYWNSSMSTDAYQKILQNQGSIKKVAEEHSVEFQFSDPLEYTAVIKDAWEEADRRKVD